MTTVYVVESHDTYYNDRSQIEKIFTDYNKACDFARSHFDPTTFDVRTGSTGIMFYYETHDMSVREYSVTTYETD